MEHERMGGWTRRRAALLTGGLTAVAMGMLGREETTAKHKKHKKRCPVCRSGEDFCAGFGTPPCGAGCRCLTRLAGGTRCAVFGNSIQCGDCETDADCTGFGKGAFCADGSGPNCCDAAGRGFCAVACSA